MPVAVTDVPVLSPVQVALFPSVLPPSLAFTALPGKFTVMVASSRSAFVVAEKMNLPFSWDIDQEMLEVPSGGMFVVDILHAGSPSCSICSTVAGFGPSMVGKFSFLQNWENASPGRPEAVMIRVRSTSSSPRIVNS